MALEVEEAPRPVRLAGLPRTAARPVEDGSGRPLTGGLLDPSAGSETAPDLSSDRPKVTDLVPQYRIPSETPHVSQQRSPSTKKRRMRHMIRDPLLRRGLHAQGASEFEQRAARVTSTWESSAR
jgi:hypothetical protein